MLDDVNPAALALAAALAALPLHAAQAGSCNAWTPGFAAPQVEGTRTQPAEGASQSAVFDDGSGPKLYVALRDGITRWTGTSWERVFDCTAPELGIGELRATTDAGVPVLLAAERPYLAGYNASHVWRFDGATWTQLGTVDFVVWNVDFMDDGTGTRLFAGGGSGTANIGYVAQWNGASWTHVGAQLPAHMFALASSVVSGVPRLYVGGLGGVYRWDGSVWTSVPSLPTTVFNLRAFDAGAGEQLYAGLGFNRNALFRYDGASWTSVGPLNGQVVDLEVADLGAGPRLLVAGSFALALAAYDGTTLSALGSGIGPYVPSGLKQVWTVAAYLDGSTPHVFAMGSFGAVGGLSTSGIGEWDGSAWSTLGHGMAGPVAAFTTHDFGSGRELVAAGSFIAAGGAMSPAHAVARWNGSAWTSASAFAVSSSLMNGAHALASVDFGQGPVLFLGGVTMGATYRGWLRYFGPAWGPPAGEFGNVFALCGFDTGAGPRLAVGGQFTVAGFGPGENIFQYDGVSTSPLGSGMDNLVSALVVHDDGSGAALYAAGEFLHAGGVPAAHIAKWDGTSWSALASGLTGGGVNALCSFRGDLYASGSFTNAGGVTVQYLARWDGSAWSDVPGGGADGAVLALCVHDDGRGPALYVGGGFSSIGGITAYNLARFDETTWEPVQGGLSGPVYALASHDDDGDGDDELFVGGSFLRTATMSSGNFARLEGCPHYASFCFGDGSFTDHTTPCPCGNNGAPGNGCAHSFDAGGANLSATGSTFADTVVLHSQFEPVSSFTLFLQQANQGDAVFHDGVLCAANPLVRLRGRGAVGGEAFFPNSTFAQDTTTSLSIRGGVTTGSGVTRYYSAFYRNASTTFCPPATANVTNGVRVIW